MVEAPVLSRNPDAGVALCDDKVIPTQDVVWSAALTGGVVWLLLSLI